MICGVSYDKIRLGFEQLGFPVARSTLCRAMQRLARRAKPTRDALVEALRASPVVYADETGWKQGGRRVWLWVFTNLRETAWFERCLAVLTHPRGRRLGPLPLLQEATTDLLQPSVHRCHEPRRPRAGRCGLGGHPARPRLARSARCSRSARMACALPSGTPPAKMNRLLQRPCGRRGHQLSRRTRHSHRRGQPQDLRRRQPYRERGTGPSILMSVLQSCRHKGIRVIDIVDQSFVLPTTPPSP